MVVIWYSGEDFPAPCRLTLQNCRALLILSVKPIPYAKNYFSYPLRVHR